MSLAGDPTTEVLLLEKWTPAAKKSWLQDTKDMTMSQRLNSIMEIFGGHGVAVFVELAERLRNGCEDAVRTWVEKESKEGRVLLWTEVRERLDEEKWTTDKLLEVISGEAKDEDELARKVWEEMWGGKRAKIRFGVQNRMAGRVLLEHPLLTGSGWNGKVEPETFSRMTGILLWVEAAKAWGWIGDLVEEICFDLDHDGDTARHRMQVAWNRLQSGPHNVSVPKFLEVAGAELKYWVWEDGQREWQKKTMEMVKLIVTHLPKHAWGIQNDGRGHSGAVTAEQAQHLRAFLREVTQLLESGEAANETALLTAWDSSRPRDLRAENFEGKEGTSIAPSSRTTTHHPQLIRPTPQSQNSAHWGGGEGRRNPRNRFRGHCYNCGKPGHTARDCWSNRGTFPQQLPKQQQQQNEPASGKGGEWEGTKDENPLPGLYYPQADKPITSTADASSQEQLIDGERRQVPLMYGGRRFRDAEKNWCSLEKEAIAAMEGLGKHTTTATRGESGDPPDGSSMPAQAPG